MTKRFWLFAAASTLLFHGVASAQYPILDAVAGKVVQKYEQSTCQQLWVRKGEPKSRREQEVVQTLRNADQDRA